MIFHVPRRHYKEMQCGETSLHLVFSVGSHKYVSFAFEKGTEADIRDDQKQTPLDNEITCRQDAVTNVFMKLEQIIVVINKIKIDQQRKLKGGGKISI